MAASTEYIPGVCNIGRAEVRQRKVIGWIGLAATVVAWIACVVLKVSPLWRLALFIPASIAATGFLQAAWHFCATFGVLGVSNFGPKVGRTDTVRHEDTAEQAEFRRQDRRTALKIIALSLVAGIAVAAAAYLLPL
jgi:cobalamin biosynthesis protein CobD/CbiB